MSQFTATPGACCTAFWGVAESSDGVHFDLLSMNETGANHLNTSTSVRVQRHPPPSRLRPRNMFHHDEDGIGAAVSKDGSSILIDDDGTGYVA